MSAVLVDISRLIARRHFTTPTGIDRFELQYARWNLDRHGSDAIFVETRHAGPVVIPKAHACDLIRTTEQRWAKPVFAGEQAAHHAAVIAAIDGLRPWQAIRKSRSVAAKGAEACQKLLSVLQGVAQTGASLPQDSVLLHVSHARLDRPDSFHWLQRPSRSGIFYVHDLIPLSHPEYVRLGEPERHFRRMETVLRHARLVLTNSQTTALALDQLAAQRGLPQPCTAVIRPGVDDVFLQPLTGTAASAERPYFVCVSTIEPRKNHALLLNLWRRLVERYGAAAPRLVIVGRRGWENDGLFRLLDQPAIFQGTVIEVADLADNALAHLMAGSAGLLAPSFVEGFGMPVAEAFALGIPVIASNIRSHREVAGNSAVLLDPLNGPGWLAAIEAHTTMPRRGGRTAKSCWTWAEHFRALDSLMASSTNPLSARTSYQREKRPQTLPVFT